MWSEEWSKLLNPVKKEVREISVLRTGCSSVWVIRLECEDPSQRQVEHVIQHCLR